MNPALLQRQRVVHMPINHGLFEVDRPHLCCPVCGFRNVHLATVDFDQGHVRMSANDDEARIGRSERHCHHRDPQTRKMIVELRSTGGQTVVGPSIHPSGQPYEVLTSEPAVVPGPMLAACVTALAKRVVEIRYGSAGEPRRGEVRVPTSRPRHQPSADREDRALAYLEKMPPAISGSGGHSDTYAAATALVHGFELELERAFVLLQEHYNPRCEPPWSDKELRHNVEDVATKPHDRPRGWLLGADDGPAPDPGVDISAIVDAAAGVGAIPAVPATAVPEEPVMADPGPVPDDLLMMPGFVDDVMRFTLDTAPYPNRPLAFVGAIALLGTLTGRKVREPGNVRTNLQILALASSGVGKDWPRKVNASVLLHAEETRKIAGKSASREGLNDRPIGHPVILKQDDEIDTLFENMRDNKEARYRNQYGMLLELYGEAGGWRAIRDRAGEKPGLIYQPHLVLFGTTTPGEFYGSLSGKMLNKGLLARLITVEAGERGQRKRPDWRDPPESIVNAAKQWATFWPPGWDNLSDESCGQATPLQVSLQVLLVFGRGHSVHARSTILAGASVRFLQPIEVHQASQRSERHLRRPFRQRCDPFLFR